MFDRVNRLSRRHLLQGAGGVALGLGVLAWRARARATRRSPICFRRRRCCRRSGRSGSPRARATSSRPASTSSFAVGRGGVDVAKQVGAGNAPLGGIVADGPIMVRGNGVPVKIVCLFGGKGFMQLVVREDSGIEKPADLKGKTITVMSYQDTTFYALLGLLASAGLTQNDVNIQSVGPIGVWQFVATGKSVGMAGVPDWIPPVQAAGVKVKVIPTDEFFPHMAQADRGLRSDHQGQARDGAQVRQGGAARHEGHDGRSGQGGGRVRDVRAGMEGQGRPGQVRLQHVRQADLSGAEGARRGRSGAAGQAAGLLSAKGFIQKETPVDELYTNQFVK